MNKEKKNKKKKKEDPNSSVFSDATANEILSCVAVAPQVEEEDCSSLLLPGHLGGVPRSGPEQNNSSFQMLNM